MVSYFLAIAYNAGVMHGTVGVCFSFFFRFMSLDYIPQGMTGRLIIFQKAANSEQMILFLYSPSTGFCYLCSSLLF